MESKLILFQGDSVTDANRMREDQQTWNKGHRLGDGYANFVAAKIGYNCLDKNYSFINKGLAGNRIRDLYARIQEDAINLKPDILSILIGVNEVWCKIHQDCGTVEPKRFEAVYRLMLDEIREKLPDTKLIIIEPFLLDVETMTNGYAAWKAYLEPLQPVVKRVAEEFGCIFIPMQSKFNELCTIRPAEYWIWDGVHPTSAGHEAIAKAWLEAAQGIL